MNVTKMSIRQLRPKLKQVMAELTKVKAQNAAMRKSIESYKHTMNGMRERIKALNERGNPKEKDF